MGDLTQTQAREMFDSVNNFIVFSSFIVIIFRIVFAILLFVLVIKAIKYLNNKNKYNCATCKYKQRYNKEEIDRAMTITVSDNK